MPNPPSLEARPTALTHHGITRIDPYAWLSDRENPEVLAYLEANNDHVAASLAHLEGLQRTLYEEFVARIEQTDLSVPARSGPYWYYQRTVEGLDYPIACRRLAGEAGEAPPSLEDAVGEEVVFDENAEAGDAEYFAVGTLAVSPDHAWLAYATETRGDERYALRFRRLADGVESPETIEATTYSFAWANDSATVFYVTTDNAQRPHRVWRHVVGADPSADVLVYEEADERFSVSVGTTKDRRAIVVHAGSKTTAESWTLDPDTPTMPLACVQARRDGVDYAVDHHRGADGADRLVLLTNELGPDFALVVCDRDGSNRAVLVPHRPGTRIDGADPFATFVVVDERLDGERRLRVVPFDGTNATDAFERSHLVPTTTRPATTWEGENPEFTSTSVRFGETSLVTPSTVAALDVATASITVLKRQAVRGDFESDRYVTERRTATTPDGTEVPISLVYRADLAGPGHAPAPCLLYGYGAYEHSIDPTFSSLRLSLLDRGLVFAIAHIRGGGELGRAWYEGGRLEAKANTFSDFVAVARALGASGLVDPARIVARGGSAGGLLMGAIANLAPDAFCGIVAEVPFVDCLTTMLDATLPLTIGEYEEWGNPEASAEVFAAMAAYSPYDNVVTTEPDGRPRRYPPIYATAGLNDPRVSYFEPAKWVAKLRAANPENVVLLRTEMGAGHGGPSGRYDAWKDEAVVYSFILDCVGAAEA